MFYTIVDCPQFPIILVGDEAGLTNLYIDVEASKVDFEIKETWTRKDEFFKKEIKQLLEYFNGSRQTFDLQLNPQGTSYQKKVWAALEEIPYGQFVTYKDVAIATGNEKASRAVGMANGKNPIPIIIPCHRVIGSNGKLTGFAFGLEVKSLLLSLEEGNIDN